MKNSTGFVELISPTPTTSQIYVGRLEETRVLVLWAFQEAPRSQTFLAIAQGSSCNHSGYYFSFTYMSAQTCL